MTPTLKISSDQNGKRLDVLLARMYPDYSRSFLQKWIKEGRVTQGGKELISNYRVRSGETIVVADFKEPSPLPHPKGRGQSLTFSLQGEGGRRSDEGLPKLPILFEDASILVLNKPANLVVHPAPSHRGVTLVDWLEDYLGPKVTGLFADASRLGVVHRLDKDTTGVILVAKTVTAQNNISKQFQDRQVKKTYAAFVEGIPKASTGVISAPIGRSQNVPSRMAVSSMGRPSETSFEVIEVFPATKSLAGAPSSSGAKEVSQVNLHPKTGRTHQIRVHCAAIGHPIVGDRTYGAQTKWLKDYGITRPLLHAERLELQHPVTRKKVSFKAPWPADMKKALALFRRSMKVIVLVVSLGVGARTLYAQDSDTTSAAPSPPKTTHTSQSSSSTSTKALKREMSSLKEQFKSLIEEVSALQDRVTGIQSSLDQLGASGRLRDLEKAISDLDGKAANTSNITEETKSEMLDLSRKVKNQQDILEQMRDQIDRLQQELIQAKAHEGVRPPSPPSGETK
jgi:23S rRNA pseudouridine1911/1915/1917 synthase